ncbi:MAG: urease accessory protein [Granulosicoccus sp.]|jgi:urease accessory protein
MITDVDSLAQLRLLQLLSPVLPVGSFTYSQGLEWAVDAKWVDGEVPFRQWLVEWIEGPLIHQELPILSRLYKACAAHDEDALIEWSQYLLATRDTYELRQEELSRADAYLRVLKSLGVDIKMLPLSVLKITPLASIAWAAARWKIPLQPLLISFGHNWLESSVNSGVKIIPLGQSAGQKIIHDLSPKLIDAVALSHRVENSELGFSMPAVSMASCSHETQYSRLYRS